MAKKRLRDIPKGSMAARARAASVRRRKSADGEPTKWSTRTSYATSTGIGDSVVPVFRPIRGDTKPITGMYDSVKATWVGLGAAAAAAIVLAVVQTRAATPRTA